MSGPFAVTVLGCDGSYAGAGGACSGYLVTSGPVAVWVDCGPGTLANLQRHIDLRDLTAIVVSHAHPDHWVELPVVHNALFYYMQRVGVPLFGTAELRRRLEGARGNSAQDVFDWHTITDRSTFAVDGLRFTCSLTDHPVETLALRVDDAASGASLGYSADTGPGWHLASLGEGLDLALCEATLPAGDDRGIPHLTTTDAGRMAREADVQRLVITHLAPGTAPAEAGAQASEAFGADVALAVANATFQIGTGP